MKKESATAEVGDGRPRRKRRKTLRIGETPNPDAQPVEDADGVPEEPMVMLDSMDVVLDSVDTELPSDIEELQADDLVEDDVTAAAGDDGEEEADSEALELEPDPEPEPVPPPRPNATPPPSPPKMPPATRAEAVAAAAVAALAAPPKKKRSKTWSEEIFDEDYLRTLPFLTPKATQREAAFLVDALQIFPGQQVLDVGCGYGRHAMELAARGFRVVALDLSLPLLLRGADESQRRGLTIDFVHGDMRELGFDAQFDGVYCVFSSFGFFDEDTNKKVMANLARALKPGGRLVLDVLNRDYVIADTPTRVWWEGDGCVVLEEVDFNYFASRVVSNRSIVFEDGRQLEQEISIRAYSLHELGRMLHAVNFKVLEVSGGLAARGRFFGSQSPQIILVAEKRAEPLKTAPASSDPSPNGPNGK